jgi:hypothetical protein
MDASRGSNARSCDETNNLWTALDSGLAGCHPLEHRPEASRRAAAPGDSAIRERASRILNFICRESYPGAHINREDYGHIKALYDRNRFVLGRWSITDESVDLVAKRLRVSASHLSHFLGHHCHPARRGVFRFDPGESYKPRGPRRWQWFSQKLTITENKPGQTASFPSDT